MEVDTPKTKLHYLYAKAVIYISQGDEYGLNILKLTGLDIVLRYCSKHALAP